MTKNSETEISRCFVARDSAVTRWAALGSGVAGGGSSAGRSAPASFGFPAAGRAFFVAALASGAGGAPSPKRSSWGRPALPFFVALCAFATASPSLRVLDKRGSLASHAEGTGEVRRRERRRYGRQVPTPVGRQRLPKTPVLTQQAGPP